MKQRKNTQNYLLHLSANDLEQWAGHRIISRGKSYQKNGAVYDVAVTADDCLIAWVSGSREYAAFVGIDTAGNVDYACTCPFEPFCKHCVALVLEYQQLCAAGEKPPLAGKDDERLQLLQEVNYIDDAAMPLEELEKTLGRKSKAELIRIILDFAGQDGSISERIVAEAQAKKGNVDSIVSRLKRDIRKMADKPGWQHHWNHEGYTPDFSDIRRNLQLLVAAGHADQVLELAELMIKECTDLIEISDDDGETAGEVGACMPVVVRALEQSSLPVPDRILWAVDVCLYDRYDLFTDLAEYLQGEFSDGDWSIVADRLLEKLSLHPTDPKKLISRDYWRDKLSNRAIDALDAAGREDESITVCRDEVRKTHSYVRLVKRLLDAELYEEAESWIRTGLHEVGAKYAGTASRLRELLGDIRLNQQDLPALCSLLVFEFVESSNEQSYDKCLDCAEKVLLRDTVRQLLLDYLEKGTLPWKQQRWPLPRPELPDPDNQYRNLSFPDCEKLIDIAMHERDPERVLYWYDHPVKKESRYFFYSSEHRDGKIAEAVRDFAPERSAAIWQRLAEVQIGRVKREAYYQAAGYLKKVRAVMVNSGKSNDWEQYLGGLRKTHQKKRRLMEVLEEFGPE